MTYDRPHLQAPLAYNLVVAETFMLTPYNHTADLAARAANMPQLEAALAACSTDLSTTRARLAAAEQQAAMLEAQV